MLLNGNDLAILLELQFESMNLRGVWEKYNEIIEMLQAKKLEAPLKKSGF